MSKNILWLDNDPTWIDPYVAAIKQMGHEVTVVTTVTKAELAIKSNRYDLLILDVMVPTKTEEEEIAYPPELTKGGTQTGLVFYQRMKELIVAADTRVLAMTLRLDEKIKDAFIAEGLPADSFATRLTLRDVSVFSEKLLALLGLENKDTEPL